MRFNRWGVPESERMSAFRRMVLVGRLTNEARDRATWKYYYDIETRLHEQLDNWVYS